MGRKRCFLQLLRTRLDVWTESPFRTNQQQCRAYSLFPRQLNGTRNPKLSNRLCKLSSSHSFSSSSSSNSKIGFLGWYLGKLESHPLITKSVTSSLIYTAADLTSQMITSPSYGSLDAIRTLRMAVYGLLILGPSQHLWFNFVSNALPKLDVLTTLKKILMGQTLYGPAITTVFFSYNASLQGESGNEIVARLKRDLLPTMINGLMYWPICDFVTYKFIPVHLQVYLGHLIFYSLMQEILGLEREERMSSLKTIYIYISDSFWINLRRFANLFTKAVSCCFLISAAINEQFMFIRMDHLFDIHGELKESEHRFALDFYWH